MKINPRAKKKGDLHNPRNFGAFGLFLTVSHKGSLGMERSWQLRGLAGCCTLFPEKMLPRCVQPTVVQAESEDNTHLPCFPQPLHVPRVWILQEEWPSPGARWRDRRRNIGNGELACIWSGDISTIMGVITSSREKLAGGIAYRNLGQLTLPKCAQVHRISINTALASGVWRLEPRKKEEKILSKGFLWDVWDRKNYFKNSCELRKYVQFSPLWILFQELK